MSQTQASAPQPKTLQEHRQFLQDMTRLQLWFIAYWLRDHAGETPAGCIRTRTDIIRKTVFNPGPLENTITPGDNANPDWLYVVDRVSEVYGRTRHAGPEVFEQQAWETLSTYVLPRAQRDMDAPDPLANFQCGSLRYNLKLDGQPAAVGFHIGNRLKPQSIFADPAYLPGCMRRMLKAVQEELGAKAIRTGTWLNSYPLWLELFPPRWVENMSEPNYNVTWSYGVWGQFISARGTLNRKHAAMFRQNGQVPFAHRVSFCEIDLMERHLDELDAKRGIDTRL